MSKSIDLWLDLVLPDVPGCPAEFARAKIRDELTAEALTAIDEEEADYLDLVRAEDAAAEFDD